MSNIDKIRQEIKRRHDYENEMYHKKKLDGRPNDGWAESLAIMGVLEELLSFIDSLPDEPVSNDLEEAAKTFCDTLEGKEAWSYGPSHYDWDDVNNAFIAGAEWMEKEINKELIKAMEKVHEIRDVDYDIHVDTSADGSFETISYYENGKLVGQERSKKEE